MNEDKIIKYLKSLVHLDPESTWLRATREELEAFVRSTRPPSRFGFPVFARNMKFATAVLVLILFVTSGAGAAFASQESLPGDTLFPVKLFTEEIQKFLSTSDEAKAELSIKFAGTRLKEVIRLSARTENQGEGGQQEIQKNIERFKLELKNSEGFLARLDINHKKKADTLKLALKFKENLAGHEEVLAGLEESLPEEARGAIRLAREAAANGRAVSLKIALKIENTEGDEEGEGEENQEETEERNRRDNENRAEGKIGAASSKIAEVERKINQEKPKRSEDVIEKAQSKLAEAKTLLEETRSDFENGAFSSAFDKAQEVIRLAQDAEQIFNRGTSENEDEEEDENSDEGNGEDEEEEENNNDESENT